MDNEVVIAVYHFKYPPQGKKEWQRVAGMKVQIANRLHVTNMQFVEYDDIFSDDGGKRYKVSELGKYLTDFVKFPMPFFDGTAQAILTRHAKRLHYENMLYVEQLIFVSMWITEIAPSGEEGRRKKGEGIRQTMKRAESAYIFAQENKEEWKVRLTKKERKKVLSQSALKSAQVKREKSIPKKEKAKLLREDGLTLQQIADEINVSLSTVSRYLK